MENGLKLLSITTTFWNTIITSRRVDVHDIKIYNEEESGSLKSIKRENEFHVECVLSTNVVVEP